MVNRNILNHQPVVPSNPVPMLDLRSRTGWYW